ncbi:unnamed protein product [Rotaria sp. Silwood1]|nr:unnamed protein product [Rotaria sp. Silwood1]
MIMPVFALANAGVTLEQNIFTAVTDKVALGIILGLFIGQNNYYFSDGNPPDLKVTYTTTSPLLNSAETIFLSRDSCYYETIFQDVTNRFTFFITSKSMDELYAVLLKYEVNKITSKTLSRAVPERMGDNLSLNWGEYSSILITNSGNYILDDKWLVNWKKIVKNICKYVKEQQDNRIRNFTVKFDESMSGKKIAMYLNNEFLYDNTLPEINIENFFVTLAAVPGQYYLKVIVGEGGAPVEFKMDIDEGTEVSFSFKGNSIQKNN